MIITQNFANKTLNNGNSYIRDVIFKSNRLNENEEIEEILFNVTR